MDKYDYLNEVEEFPFQPEINPTSRDIAYEMLKSHKKTQNYRDIRQFDNKKPTLLTERVDKHALRKNREDFDYKAFKNSKNRTLFKHDGTVVIPNELNNFENGIYRSEVDTLDERNYNFDDFDQEKGIKRDSSAPRIDQPVSQKVKSRLNKYANSGYKRLRKKASDVNLRFSTKNKSFIRLTRGLNHLADQSKVGESNRSYSRKWMRSQKLDNYQNQIGVTLLEKVRKKKNIEHWANKNTRKSKNKENLFKYGQKKQVEFSFRDALLLPQGSKTPKNQKKHSVIDIRSKSRLKPRNKSAIPRRRTRKSAKIDLKSSIDRLHGQARKNQEAHRRAVKDANSKLFNNQSLKLQNTTSRKNLKNLINVLDMKLDREFDHRISKESDKYLNYIVEGEGRGGDLNVSRRVRGELYHKSNRKF